MAGEKDTYPHHQHSEKTPVIPTNQISNLLDFSVDFVQPPAVADRETYRDSLVCSRRNIIIWLEYFESKYTSINKRSLTCTGYIDTEDLFQSDALVEQNSIP
jgi:hypothetical protein